MTGVEDGRSIVVRPNLHSERRDRMRNAIGILLLSALFVGEARAQSLLPMHGELARINRAIHGQVLDFTKNHGHDHRIWSDALKSKRDLYVYLPPGYQPAKKYPLVIFLHGAGQDERFFLKSLVTEFDQAIADGRVPPFIVAAPDGSALGRPSFLKLATFWANTDAGRYEDYLMHDVWDFMMSTFPIRPERDAHVLIGVSMGGSAAFTQAIKHKDKVKVAMGFLPALNLRWVDCHDKFETPFDPACWGWRTKACPLEVVGRPKGIFVIRFHNLYGPLIGHGPEAMWKLSRFNPIEVMETYDLKPGELDLYAGYGGKDEFNITAQVESFLYRAKERGINVGVTFDPEGRHDEASGRRLLPDALRWVTPLMERYADPKK
jgi:S-formylglutathione hydrolase FrmB